MRVEIHDAYGTPYSITTRNLDTLASWLVETIATIRPEANSAARVLTWPSFTWDAEHPHGVPDWIADTRILGNPGKILRPLDMIDYLRGQIERCEALAARKRTDSGPCHGEGM